jgi:hypothetical protein
VVSNREQRIGENEAFFRRLNEQIDDVSDEPPGPLVEFVCECGDADCTVRVRLTEAEYDAVRRGATTFLVFPGHVAHDVEIVVSSNERFAVVRKHGEAGEIAVEEDPRS